MRKLLLGCVVLLVLGAVACVGSGKSYQNSSEYEVIAWNDLGMHCYDDSFAVFSILPPFNVVWAQVIRKGEKPEIVTEGLSVSFAYEGNTTSAGKSDFWDHAKALFGADLAPGVGLTGLAVQGAMQPEGDHFKAEGIPLTEVNDDGTVDHYQVCVVTVRDASGKVVAGTKTISPLSTEMHCSSCHDDGKMRGIAAGDYRTNILLLHDRLSGTRLAGGGPVLCAGCHPSNALGTKGGIISLSHAMHKRHAFIKDTLEGCYRCHPGKNTKCLRGVMFSKGIICTDCHGDMAKVGDTARNPWLQEPDCGKCHKYGAQPGMLYRFSKGPGGIYCEACHGSTHAEYPSGLDKDNAQSIRLQGKAGPIGDCAACHGKDMPGGAVHTAMGM